jgi:hypothetical protein
MGLMDPAFYHTLMMISAANIAGLQGSDPPPLFWYHRGQAMTLVRTKLHQFDAASVDKTIACIGVLLISDVRYAITVLCRTETLILGCVVC